MNIRLPEKVNQIIHTLQEHGFEAYAVGGCVRDCILERIPDDWDITTSAMPHETKALFPRTFDTGIEHGTITVLIDKEAFEVTTYRIDGKYADSRHPLEVTFTRSLKEDLLRRDFTINAMAYNEEEGLVDIFGGMQDIRNRTIRCVGNAKERFSEDALRILRALRFAAQLDFAIAPETRMGMQELAPTLVNISAERIQVELIKMLVSKHPEMMREAYNLGITKVILPEFDKIMETTQETPHHDLTVGEHTLKAMQYIRAEKVLRLTMLFHDIAKPSMKTFDEEGVAHFKKHDEQGAEVTRRILKRLKFDNDTLNKVVKLVLYHDYRMPAQPTNIRRAMSKIGKELFPYYLEVRTADTLAQSEYLREEKLQSIRDIETQYQRILSENECVSLKDLAVTGADLIEHGMEQGKEIGVRLDRLLQHVIEHPKDNTKEILLQLNDSF